MKTDGIPLNESKIGNNDSIDVTMIEMLIGQGNFEGALKLIETHEESETISQATYYPLQNWKNTILIRKGQVEEGLKQTEILIHELESSSLFLTLIDTYITKTEALISLDNYDLALETLTLGLLSLKKFTITGNLPDISQKQRLGFLQYLKGNAYFRKGKLDLAIEALEDAKRIFSEINHRQGMAQTLNRLGTSYIGKSDFLQGEKLITESLQINRQLGFKQDISTCLNNLGIISISLGRLNEALDYFQQGLAIDTEINDIRGHATTLVNIGEIHRLKGDLEQALEVYKQSYNESEATGAKASMSICLNDMGILYWQKGELKQAYDLLKQAQAIGNEIGFTSNLSETYLYLISVSIDEGNLDQAKTYLNALQEVLKNDNQREVLHRARIAEALILRQSSKARNKGKAESLLEQVTNDEMVSQELTVKAMLHLAEVLLEELLMEEDTDILADVKRLTTRLQEIAKSQHSHWLLAETYWLSSKLALMELNFREARRLLTLAQLLAEERGLQRLAQQISIEHDALLTRESEWEDAITKNVSLPKRAELAEIDDLMKRIIRKNPSREKTNDIPTESPVLLLVIASSGVTLYSTVFKSLGINDQLISNLLTAINAFSGEVFENTLDRAKFGQYNLVLKPLEPMLVCYVFEGPSYFATRKVDKFVRTIKETGFIYQALTRCLTTCECLGNHEKELANDVVQSVFLKH